MGSSRGSRSTKNGSVMAEERRDPYEVLGVSRNATDQEIKTAYRKMALELHPDKNGNNPEAVELFKEVAYSYGILSDPEKRRHYDGLGFQGVELENMDMELDLSNLGTVNTVFAAIFSKLGVPIKTSVSPNILEDALSGAIQIRPLPLGHVLHDKVEKQGAHFYGLTISKTQAEAGIVIQVTSSSSSKFKLLYFEQEENGGYGLALQEDSMKSGKITSAGMYFLHFQVYRFDPTVNALALGKDPEAILFKCLEGLLPCEMSELKAGTHVFAVYGDNFFKSTSYSIEAICAESFRDATDYLREMESQMLEKRTALRQFENEYREAAARFAAVTNRYAEEKLEVTELLKRREKIHRLFSSAPQKTYTHSSSQKVTCDDSEFGSASQSPESEGKKKSRRKKWFGLKAKKSV